MIKTLQKYLKKILIFIKKNYKLIIAIIVGIYCLQKINEGFDSDKKMVVLFKPVQNDRGLHHINLSKLELYDSNNEKVPLTSFKSTSYGTSKYDSAKLLDGKNETFFHTGWRSGDIWKINTYANQYDKNRYVAFTYPADKHIKKVYIRNRDGNTDKCCGNRAGGMKVKFFSDINADPNGAADKEYPLEKKLDINIVTDVPAKAAPEPEPEPEPETTTGTTTETPTATTTGTEGEAAAEPAAPTSGGFCTIL